MGSYHLQLVQDHHNYEMSTPDSWVVPVSPPKHTRRDSTCMIRTGSNRDLTRDQSLHMNDAEDKVKPRINPLRAFTWLACFLVIYFAAQLIFVSLSSNPEQARLTLSVRAPYTARAVALAVAVARCIILQSAVADSTADKRGGIYTADTVSSA